MPLKKSLVAALLLLTVPAQAETMCESPLEPMLRVEFYFGSHIEGRPPVAPREWARFVADELTPNFPGLTVVDGRGEWRRGQHHMREFTKLVIAVLPDGPAARGKIAVAAESYKQRFNQTSVGVVTQSVCAAF
jgi:hypothetical protein